MWGPSVPPTAWAAWRPGHTCCSTPIACSTCGSRYASSRAENDERRRDEWPRWEPAPLPAEGAGDGALVVPTSSVAPPSSSQSPTSPPALTSPPLSSLLAPCAVTRRGPADPEAAAPAPLQGARAQESRHQLRAPRAMGTGTLLRAMRARTVRAAGGGSGRQRCRLARPRLRRRDGRDQCECTESKTLAIAKQQEGKIQLGAGRGQPRPLPAVSRGASASLRRRPSCHLATRGSGVEAGPQVGHGHATTPSRARGAADRDPWWAEHVNGLQRTLCCSKPVPNHIIVAATTAGERIVVGGASSLHRPHRGNVAARREPPAVPGGFGPAPPCPLGAAYAAAA